MEEMVPLALSAWGQFRSYKVRRETNDILTPASVYLALHSNPREVFNGLGGTSHFQTVNSFKIC